MQRVIQNQLIRRVLASGEALRMPLPLRLFKVFPVLRRIPARLIGMGVRPEHVRIASPGRLAAVVQSAEYLGADTIVTCTAGPDMIAARVPGQHDLAAGARIELDWQDGDQHFFDVATGKRRDDVHGIQNE